MSRRRAQGRRSRRAAVRLAQAGQRDPAVTRRVEPVERTEAGLLLVGARPLRPPVGPDPRVGVEVDAAVHDRRVDELALAGALAPVERHQHREGRLHRAGLVAHPEAVPVGSVALTAELLLEPARRLRELVEAGPGGAWSVVPPHRRVAIDHRRVQPLGGLVVDAEALGDARPHVVVHDVDLAHEAVRDLQPLGLLEVVVAHRSSSIQTTRLCPRTDHSCYIRRTRSLSGRRPASGGRGRRTRRRLRC